MCAEPNLAPADRRASPRYDVLESQIVVVDVGCDSGGIVLNCSRDGIAIQAIGPLPRHRGELLLYLPHIPKPVLAVGDLVWANESHQAGIAFSAHPSMARSQLAEWFEQTAHRHFACVESTATIPGSLAWQQLSTPQQPVPQLHTALDYPVDPSVSVEHSVVTHGADEVLADDPEPGRIAFIAAAVLSLILTLLCSSLMRRPTSLPAIPVRDRQRPVSLHDDPSAPSSVSSATPNPISVSPPKPHIAAHTSRIRSRSRRVRRNVQGEDDDEVTVRYFARPAPAASPQEQRTSPPR
jgi:hypothetical protein